VNVINGRTNVLILDDVLFFPVRGIWFVLREIYHAARQELENEAQAIRSELSELYMMLETGRLTEKEFDQRESELLDRLDEMEEQGSEDRENDNVC